MKHLIFIITLIITLTAERIEIIRECNIRKAPMQNENAVKTGQTTQIGQIFDVLGTYCDYCFVRVSDATTGTNTVVSTHAGQQGYLWARRLKSIAIGPSSVVIEGVCLRSAAAKKDDNLIAKICKNAAVEVLSQEITWYKVESGWIWAECVKPIK